MIQFVFTRVRKADKPAKLHRVAKTKITLSLTSIALVSPLFDIPFIPLFNPGFPLFWHLSYTKKRL